MLVAAAIADWGAYPMTRILTALLIAAALIGTGLAIVSKPAPAHAGCSSEC